MIIYWALFYVWSAFLAYDTKQKKNHFALMELTVD